jgi:hypothetical protein
MKSYLMVLNLDFLKIKNNENMVQMLFFIIMFVDLPIF